MLFAFDFDQTQWEQDVKNLRRFEILSQNMRIHFKDFAAENKNANSISGQGHALADETVSAYARIRHHVGQIARRWEDAVPERKALGNEAKSRVKGTALTLAASAVLLKNASSLIENFDGTIWENRLNQGALDRTQWHKYGLYEEVVRSFTSSDNHKKFECAADYLDGSMETIQVLAINDPERMNYILGLIAYSGEIKQIKDESFIDRQTGSAGGMLNSFKAAIDRTMSSAMNSLSKTFGNIVGNIHTGTASIVGDLRDKTVNDMMAVLKPGDILLDKCEFAITDKIIPGHFGHVAIWLGTPGEMEELGLFDSTTNHQSLNKAREYEKRLLEGHSVLEALRPGVECNSLHHFLNVDEVAILRLKQGDMSDSEYRQVIVSTLTRGLYHLGQAYDFNFDVNTSDTIVCSELAYQAFPDNIQWPTSEAAGRLTISPDHVAVMGGPAEEMPFEVIYFQRKDEFKVSGPSSWKRYWKSMKGDAVMPEPTNDFNNLLLKSIEQVNP